MKTQAATAFVEQVEEVQPKTVQEENTATSGQEGVPHDPYWSTYQDYLVNIP